MNPETEKEFEKFWWTEPSQPTRSGDQIIVEHFINVHFIDRRVLEEELMKMIKNEGVLIKSGEYADIKSAEIGEYNQAIYDLKDKLLNTK